jgi:catechol 2,3-dioxygenase-like lactoylglutathione lyase family enzyme
MAVNDPSAHARVSHMVLPVSNVQRSRDWYVDKLSFALERELEGAVGIKDRAGLTRRICRVPYDARRPVDTFYCFNALPRKPEPWHPLFRGDSQRRNSDSVQGRELQLYRGKSWGSARSDHYFEKH